MNLTEQEKQQIYKILKRNHRTAWTNEIILKATDILEQIRDGTVDKDSFIAPGLTYEEYTYQIYLNQFI